MKKFISLFIASIALFSLCACTTTTITETQYADDGVTVVTQKVSETSGNPLVILAENSAEKSWTIRQGGWKVNLGYDPQTQALGIQAGTVDNSMSSFTNSEYGVEIAKAIPAIYAESKYMLSISKDGIGSEGAAISKEKPVETPTE